MSPDISILMSAYNGEAYVSESIRSVLNQDFENFEMLIIDDNSEDRTADLISAFTDTDSRFSLYRNGGNRGLYRNLNELMRKSRGALIKLWSQDDVMLPHCLSRGWHYFEQHRDIGYFFSSFESIELDGTLSEAEPDSTPTVLDPSTADYYCLVHGNLSANISNMFVPAKTIRRIGEFNVDYVSADFELAVRAQRHFPAGRIPEALVRLRHHPGQWSLADGIVVDFLREDIEISNVLRDRLTGRYGRLTQSDADEILHERFGKNYFHYAVGHISKGEFTLALTMLKMIRTHFSLTPVALKWIRSLPQRIAAGRP